MSKDEFIKATPEERLRGLKRIRVAAVEVARKFKLSPGGDLYTYEGSANAVDELKEKLDEYAGLDFRLKK